MCKNEEGKWRIKEDEMEEKRDNKKTSEKEENSNERK
jgi:hypothetical protein